MFAAETEFVFPAWVLDSLRTVLILILLPDLTDDGQLFYVLSRFQDHCYFRAGRKYLRYRFLFKNMVRNRSSIGGSSLMTFINIRCQSRDFFTARLFDNFCYLRDSYWRTVSSSVVVTTGVICEEISESKYLSGGRHFPAFAFSLGVLVRLGVWVESPFESSVWCLSLPSANYGDSCGTHNLCWNFRFFSFVNRSFSSRVALQFRFVCRQASSPCFE